MTLHKDDSILEAYLIETSQLVEQLEEIIIECENANVISDEMVNEIFRIMHTIKGSSSMMQYNNIATLAHALEDLFSFWREQRIQLHDLTEFTDLMLEGIDFTKVELHKIRNGASADGDATSIIEAVKLFLQSLEQLNEQGSPQSIHLKADIFFTEDCEMENVRAYQIVHQLKEVTSELKHIPENLLDDELATMTIRNQGFQLFMKTEKNDDEIYALLSSTSYLRHVELQRYEPNDQPIEAVEHAAGLEEAKESKSAANSLAGQTINVNVDKLDELMDLVGELVIAEAMVTQHSELAGLELEQYNKAASQLQKITKEIQDKVMEIRMVPLASTFLKMNRVVRDMSRKLGKDVQLKIIGEETEVDKKVIEHIADPIMHMVRNAIDHGLETAEERLASGKPATGTLTLEAEHVGGEVVISVRDDGRGLNKEKLLQRAVENGLLENEEAELSDHEIYNLIFVPGFSTNHNITEFSGRGVGMDVVKQNIVTVGGTVTVDSVPGNGTSITMKIPLTLAIIDGMTVRVGEMRYTLPTTSIIESFKCEEEEIITDPSGNELIMVRGDCYPILRLRDLHDIHSDAQQHDNEGIFVMVEQDHKKACILVDELVAQQQVVVKSLPSYMRSLKRVDWISGCTLLGDGDISLILDIQGLLNLK